jgi:hypothetical protein
LRKNAFARANPRIPRAYTRSRHHDDNLSFVWFRNRELAQLENVRSAKLVNLHCLHHGCHFVLSSIARFQVS